MEDNFSHEFTRKHHVYTLCACLSEFVMTFALHVLAPLHVVTPAVTLAAVAFIVYVVISLRHFRFTLSAITSLTK
ncbi:MAG: hypothetical protein AB9919_13005 [Geobacteraceae bacterium]